MMSELSHLQPPIWEIDMSMSNATSNATAAWNATANSNSNANSTATLPPTRAVFKIPPPSIDELMDRSTPAQQTPYTNAHMLYITPYTVMLVIGVLVLVAARCVQMCQVRRLRRRRRRQREAQSSGFTHGNTFLYNGVAINLPGSTPVFLDMDDRITLYKRTFEKTKLVHTLTPEDFEVDPNGGNNNNDNDKDIESAGEQQDFCYDDDDDDDEAPWIYLPFHNDNGEASDDTTSTVDEKTNNDDAKTLDDSEREEVNHPEQEQSSAEQSPAAATAAVDTDTNTDSADAATTIPTTKIPGTCVVCFEHFRVGDRVVCSQNLCRCKHVFHEDCMARFLASNSTRTKHPNYSSPEEGTSYSENPCPTCRQPFCTIPHQDIVLAIFLKSVRVALRETNSNNNNTRDTNDDDDDDDAEGDGVNSIQDVENPSRDDANEINEDANVPADNVDDATATASEDESYEGGSEEIRVTLRSDETTGIPIEDV